MWNWRGSSVASRLNRIEAKIDRLLANQAAGRAMIMSEQEEIANLIQKVSENKDAVKAATMALSGLLDRVASLGQELQDAIAANSSDVSPDIKAAADELQASTAALQDAVPHVAAAIMKGTAAE
jgi:chromosome segregation ATPase